MVGESKDNPVEHASAEELANNFSTFFEEKIAINDIFTPGHQLKFSSLNLSMWIKSSKLSNDLRTRRAY